jgi:uncharacterized protein (DUF2336 family)
MTASQSLMGELDEAIRCGSSDKRVETLRRITDLFLSNSNRLPDVQVEVFGAVLGRLINDIETKALSELSQRLAPTRNAPIEVIRQLARNNEIDVAGPLLSTSTQLTTADLVDIASSKGQEHLLAISCRGELQEDVTDILVDRGDSQVARSVAANRGARFSATGFSNLVERAQQDEGLAERVATRSEMSPELLRQLTLKATAAVRQRLISVSNPEAHATIDNILMGITAEIDQSDATRPKDYAIAQDLVASLQHDKALLKAKLVEFAAAEQFEEVVAGLAALTGLKVEAVEQCLTNGDKGGILILCRAIKLEWATVSVILTLESGPRRSIALPELALRYAKLNNATAERILRFWQIRTTVAA